MLVTRSFANVLEFFRQFFSRLLSLVKQYPWIAIVPVAGIVGTAVLLLRKSSETPTLKTPSAITDTIKKELPVPLAEKETTQAIPEKPKEKKEEKILLPDTTKSVVQIDTSLTKDTSKILLPPVAEEKKETVAVVAAEKKDTLAESKQDVFEKPVFHLDSLLSGNIPKSFPGKREKKKRDKFAIAQKDSVKQLAIDSSKQKDTVLTEQPLDEKDTTLQKEGEEEKEIAEQIDSTGKEPIAQIKDTIPTVSRIDSIALGLFKDTTYVVELDSTERMAQWNNFQNPSLFASPFHKRQSGFSLKINHPAYQKEVKLDSAGNTIAVNEMWYGEEMRPSYSLTLDEYIQQRVEFEQRKLWEDSIYAYQFKNLGKDALGSLFSTITNIDIPVPSNPLFSIFGPPRINLRVSGAVDIHAGFRTQKSYQVSVNARDQSNTDPNFNQEVQVNVNGTIGDKLNILADWNTQRTFEYENQLKLKYTGYDDEIVQSVQAGNVSMEAPGFFGSSQALFGVKAQMQFGPVKLLTLASQKKGQIKEVSVSGGSRTDAFDIYAPSYSTDHYFLDTIYRKQFETFYGSSGQVIERGDIQISDIEVWVTRTSQQQPGDRTVVAVINIPPYAPNDPTYEALRMSNQSANNGDTVAGLFYRLERGVDYVVQNSTGYITLQKNLQQGQAVAAAYRIQDGTQYGNLVLPDSGNIVLKLVRPTTLIPSYTTAWRHQLRNIYKLPGKKIKKEGFELKIFYEDGAEKKESINPFGKDEKLFTIIGLDKKNAD